MTAGPTPKTLAAIERVREMYAQAEASGERLTVAEIGREIGCSRTYAGRLLERAGLAPMPRAKGAPRRKPKPLSRHECVRRAGSAKTAAKAAASRATLERARAMRPTSEEIARMSPEELGGRAAAAKSRAGAARWVRRMVRAGYDLTPAQVKILKAEGWAERRVRRKR